MVRAGNDMDKMVRPSPAEARGMPGILPSASLQEWVQRAMQWKAIADTEATKCYAELRPELKRLRTENRRLKNLLAMRGIAY